MFLIFWFLVVSLRFFLFLGAIRSCEFLTFAPALSLRIRPQQQGRCAQNKLPHIAGFCMETCRNYPVPAGEKARDPVPNPASSKKMPKNRKFHIFSTHWIVLRPRRYNRDSNRKGGFAWEIEILEQQCGRHRICALGRTGCTLAHRTPRGWTGCSYLARSGRALALYLRRSDGCSWPPFRWTPTTV